jgi:hypothetical protein
MKKLEIGDRIEFDDFRKRDYAFLESCLLYVDKNNAEVFFFDGKNLEFEFVGDVIDIANDFQTEWAEELTEDELKILREVIRTYDKNNPNTIDVAYQIRNLESLVKED